MNRLIARENAKMPVWMWVIFVFAIVANISSIAMEANSVDGEPISSIILLFVVIAAMIFSAVMWSKPFVAVYDDHIEGKAPTSKSTIVGTKVFSFANGQYTVRTDGGNVVVEANGQCYYIAMSADSASRFVSQANNPNSYTYNQPQQPIYQNQPISHPQATQEPLTASYTTAPQNIKIYCSVCGTCSQVPSGLGNIIATCPNCNNQINITT